MCNIFMFNIPKCNKIQATSILYVHTRCDMNTRHTALTTKSIQKSQPIRGVCGWSLSVSSLHLQLNQSKNHNQSEELKITKNG